MQELMVSVGQNGRIVIPANIRKLLNLKQGQVLKLHLENEKIIFEKTDDIVGKLKKRFGSIQNSLSEELILERHENAKKENS